MAVTSNASPVSRLGQINKSGDADALFLKTFSGEIITTFETASVILDRHFVRTITSGKSAQFPVLGEAGAKYHTPGASILEGDNAYLSQIAAAEKVITIDDLLIAATFIANIDEAKNHYDVRAEYANKLGYALANAWDKRGLQVGILNARSAATITGQAGGTVLNKGATVATTASVLAAALFEAAASLDNKNVPADGRVAFLRPEQYYLLVQAKDAINKDWGGQGAYSDGTVFRVAGIEIVKTINLPSTNISAVTGEKNTYSGDFTNTVALVQHRSAIGTVKLMDLAFESEYQIVHQGTLMVAKYAMGTGPLRPESSVEISKTAP